MEFPLHLTSRWGGKRYNSFNRVLKNSFNARVYKVGLSCEGYAALATDFLERLDPKIVIQRLTGETYRELTVAPQWSVNKLGSFNAIEAELEKRDTWQGRKYAQSSATTITARLGVSRRADAWDEEMQA